jgi:CBS domain-containing protein
MFAREIMNKFLVIVRPTDTVQTAVEAMTNEQVGIVCVCDESAAPIGVITDRDIVTRVCFKNLPLDTTFVTAVMTPHPLTCGLNASMEEVERAMQQRSVARVLVTDPTGGPAGVISLAEIWHYESPISAGAVSRSVTEREFRMPTPGGHFDSGRQS